MNRIPDNLCKAYHINPVHNLHKDWTMAMLLINALETMPLYLNIVRSWPLEYLASFKGDRVENTSRTHISFSVHKDDVTFTMANKTNEVEIVINFGNFQTATTKLEALWLALELIADCALEKQNDR